jgi:CheY-like chemotaxis protein
MNRPRFSPIVPNGEMRPSRANEFQPRVLVVDDESTIADTITQILRMGGYAAEATYDGESALETALLSPPHLLITDVLLPGMNGIELARTIKRVYPDCKILLFSGQASTIDLLSAEHHKGQRFTLLEKPVPPAALLAAVAQHLRATPALDFAAN